MEATVDGEVIGTSTRLRIDGRAATLEIDREPRNILDEEAIRELVSRVETLATRRDLQIVVVKGAGSDFSAGVSIEDHTSDRISVVLPLFHSLLRALVRLPAVTVAAVRGYCLGGGMELAAACDLVIASNDSRFGQPEINLGCFPPAAAAFYPPRLGHARALELLISGRSITGQEASRLGFAAWSVEEPLLEKQVAKVVEMTLAKSAAVTRLTKQALIADRERELEILEETERLYLEGLCETRDMNEGIAAFLEKRPPAWKHK